MNRSKHEVWIQMEALSRMCDSYDTMWGSYPESSLEGEAVREHVEGVMGLDGEGAQVTRAGILDMQVCVPADWTDDQVKKFADNANLCGTSGGWFVVKDGDKLLGGDPERVPCEERQGFVHVKLVC